MPLWHLRGNGYSGITKGVFTQWRNKEHVQGKVLHTLKYFRISATWSDQRCKHDTLEKSSDAFCHSTQVLVIWSADPVYRGVEKPQFGPCSSCLFPLTARNNNISLCCLAQGNPGPVCLFICKISHGYYFSECYSLMFSRSSFLRSLLGFL